MKKILALFVAVFAVFQFTSAAYTNDDLIIETKSGQKVNYSLSTRPVVTFEGTDLVLTGTGVKVLYPVADVKEITFGTHPTGVSNVKSSDITFFVSGSEITAKGLQKSDKLELYTVDGKVLTTKAVSAEGEATVDISSLNGGIYVVKAGEKSYKILK